MKLSDFDYELPRELIAQVPAAARSASRLLHLDGRSGELRDRRFCDLPQLVDAGDVLLVCHKDQAQKVRQVVDGLKNTENDKYL